MKRVLFLLLTLIAASFFRALPVAAADAIGPELPPVLTPYLQNPAADGMTVCFVAQGAEQVRVAWRAAGPVAWEELPGQGVAIAGTPWTIWKIRLAKLWSGVPYQYQVRYRLANAEAATPICQFRTLDPCAKTVRVIAFNDLHNRDATLAALMRHVQPDDYDFSLLLGDCWADPGATNGAYEVFRTLDAYVRLLDGASKPFLLVRGNHETRGSFARRLANLFDLPNLDASQPWGKDQWQFTLPAGPAFFLALDTGEDDDAGTATNSYKNPALWREVRNLEREWCEDVAARRPYQQAPWRIFLSHIPLFNSPNISVRARDCWLPQVEKFDPHLMLSGHDHTWRKPAPPSPKSPWPSLVGGGPAQQGSEEGTVMFLKADTKSLQVRLLGAKDGRVLTEFTADKSANQDQSPKLPAKSQSSGTSSDRSLTDNDTVVLSSECMTFRRISPRQYGTNAGDFFLLETEVTNDMCQQYFKATGRNIGDGGSRRRNARDDERRIVPVEFRDLSHHLPMT